MVIIIIFYENPKLHLRFSCKIQSYTCDFPIFFVCKSIVIFLYLQIFAQFFMEKRPYFPETLYLLSIFNKWGVVFSIYYYLCNGF